MKLDKPKFTIAAILLGMVTIIGLSWYWYGTDRLFLIVVGVLVVGGIVIGIDRYLLWRKNKKR